MFDPHVLALFFTTVFFLAISPGPDLLLISTYSSTKGFTSGAMISIGVLVAGVVQTCLVAFGLGELMMLMPSIALIIKLVGALYLSYLGLSMLWAWYQSLQRGKTAGSNNAEPNNAQPDKVQVKSPANSTSGGHRQLFFKGLLNNLLNPKALLFFSLFLPQFIHSQSDVSNQILILGLLLSVFVFMINLLFSCGFSQLGRLMGNKLNLSKHLDGLLGLMFMGLAVRLASSK